jgi:hypothetical protein
MRIAENKVDEVWVEYDTLEPVYVFRELANWIYGKVTKIKRSRPLFSRESSARAM